jgi:type III restriction enzyme
MPRHGLFDEDLRNREGRKIKCGTAHCKALAVGANPAIYGKFTDVDGLLSYETR